MAEMEKSKDSCTAYIVVHTEAGMCNVLKDSNVEEVSLDEIKVSMIRYLNIIETSGGEMFGHQ